MKTAVKKTFRIKSLFGYTEYRKVFYDVWYNNDAEKKRNKYIIQSRNIFIFCSEWKDTYISDCAYMRNGCESRDEIDSLMIKLEFSMQPQISSVPKVI